MNEWDFTRIYKDLNAFEELMDIISLKERLTMKNHCLIF